MIKIGLTGGIASGKSTVAHMLMKLGARLIDTDQLARQIVEPGSSALTEIINFFGSSILNPSGNLNRNYLRQIIFNDLTARLHLNAIIHPRVAALVKTTLNNLENFYPQDIVVVDIPLLFETSWDIFFPLSLLVYATPQIRIKRLISRDNIDKTQVYTALKTQIPLENKRQKAYFVIDNSSGLEETFTQARSIWNKIIQTDNKKKSIIRINRS